MLFKNRHQTRNFAVGLFITAADLDDADDRIHEREEANLARTKREAAQKRDLRREKRTVKNRTHLRTHFNQDELRDEPDLMTYLNKL